MRHTLRTKYTNARGLRAFRSAGFSTLCPCIARRLMSRFPLCFRNPPRSRFIRGFVHPLCAWRRLLALALAVMVVAGSSAQRPTIFDAPQSSRIVSYELDVSLDSATRTLRGEGRMAWRNPGAVPVDSLQLHLYLNAFKSDQTTFMRERGGTLPGFAEGWGWIDITRLETQAGADLLEQLLFIQPDDDNAADQTVAAVPMPSPVLPGEAVTLTVAFEAKLPRILARTGYEVRPDGQLFVMAAQWFPKFGVYEIPGQRYVPPDAPAGRWNAHQFHANSEFYADFGTYDVTIDVPAGYVVGATGVRVEASESDGRRRERYKAEDVHDFAWTASPAFLEYTDHWRHVNLRLLLQPEHRGQARRHFDAARIAMEGYDRMVGTYPYTTLTLVDGLGASNGMEYPTLILCGTRYGAPRWFRLSELVLIHEFGHQYFYGLLASNEFEEAWLDEGINSYVESKVMDGHYGPGSLVDLPGMPIGSRAAHRLLYAKDAPERGALVTNSWEYASAAEYGKVSYSKSATVLSTLEGYLGWPLMQKILHTYFERWRFRHPTTRDFQAVAEEVSVQDLDWFFESYVYGTQVLDYAVTDLETSQTEDGWHTTRVRVERLRDGVFPQVLRVAFADGTAQDTVWDGQLPAATFTFTHEIPAVHARIDPDFLVALDINRLNNGRAVTHSRAFGLRHTFKFTLWIQYALHMLASLF